MNDDQKHLVTQAICKRFESSSYGLCKGSFKDDVTALIDAVNSVNSPGLVTAGVEVAVNVDKGSVDGLEVGPNVHADDTTGGSVSDGIATQ